MARVGGPQPRALGVGAALFGVIAFGCTCSVAEERPESTGSTQEQSPAPPSQGRPLPPRVLYLPDAASPGVHVESLPSTAPFGVDGPRRCSAEMVDIGGRFCIDRFEASLEDRKSGQRLSPYYHPTSGQTRATYERWVGRAASQGPARSRAMAVPAPPPFQLEGGIEPVARSLRGVVPSGYLNRPLAEAACRNAGKRLCTSEEWVTACEGFRKTRFPYGVSYENGRCNVFRSAHPAAVLHGNASQGHLDPRLNQVREGDDPLLRLTGGTPECRSEWGADAAYDMVGNLDEWVSDPGGVFVGGFYARATRSGCEARIESHAPEYFDYSLGVRCCR
jgi:formylglycine-generating enzyme